MTLENVILFQSMTAYVIIPFHFFALRYHDIMAIIADYKKDS